MNTILTTSATEAADIVRRGGIVAFPTETVYGLGANVFDEAAIERIFEAKRRPADNPLIAHVFAVEQIRELTVEINDGAEKFIEAFFPGPLTLVLRKSNAVPLIATAGLDTVGVRMPRLDIARAFLRECETPLVAPSANLSGRPSPTTWQAVYEDLDGRIDGILQGDATEIGLESTVVDCSGDTPLLLRQGAISLLQLRSVISSTILATDSIEATRSPGLRHRHYSPRARVTIVETSVDAPDVLSGDGKRAFIGLSQADGAFDVVKICASIDDYAHSLFEFFRECDRQNFDQIYCEAVEESGVGGALMDRLRRAAQG